MKYLCGSWLIILCLIPQAQDKGFSRPDIPGELMVDLGLNIWDKMPQGTSRELWSSKSIGIYYSKRKGLGSKLSVYYGLGFGSEKIGLGDSSLFSMDSATVGGFPFTTTNLKKNKLAITYLDVPLEMRFHPIGTQDGEGFFVGVGGILGLKLNAHTKWKYDESGKTKKQKVSGAFDLRSFRYGYQIRLGFKDIHLFYKQYLSDVFNNSVGTANPTMTTFGVNLTGF